ncbi:hypothetical protein AAMO2058_000094100 [Amorphochlora amoebiformis]
MAPSHRPVADGQVQRALLESRGGGREKTRENSTTRSFLRFVSFLALVLVQGAHILFFRLSQTNGHYKYNTASAIAITELMKLTIAGCLFTQEKAPVVIPSITVIGSYTLIALGYAINNQLAMYLLVHMGTSMLSLGKSVTPLLTAFAMWLLFKDEKFVSLQGICFLLLTMGLICLFSPSESADGVGAIPLTWLIFSILLTAFNSVFNCRILQKGSSSMQMQNILLYSQGFVINIVMYVSGMNATGKNFQQGFFEGYNSVWVIMVLLSQSFMGVIISVVYKYGDAIVKCFACAVQALPQAQALKDAENRKKKMKYDDLADNQKA